MKSAHYNHVIMVVKWIAHVTDFMIFWGNGHEVNAAVISPNAAVIKQMHWLLIE